jgi:hypothetical protein
MPAMTWKPVAQEGVASNHVFVFAWKPGQYAYTHSAEVKSVLEKTTRNSSKLHVYLQRPRGAQRSATERVVRCARFSSLLWFRVTYMAVVLASVACWTGLLLVDVCSGAGARALLRRRRVAARACACVLPGWPGAVALPLGATCAARLALLHLMTVLRVHLWPQVHHTLREGHDPALHRLPRDGLRRGQRDPAAHRLRLRGR